MSILRTVRERIYGFSRYKVILIITALIVFGYAGRLSIIRSMKGVEKEEGEKVSSVVALTFDDGPHVGYTERILAILDEEGVRATFFVVGKMVEKHPDLLKKEFLGGHEIGNHTYSDTRLTTLSRGRAIEEIRKCQERIVSVTGKKSLLLRPPGGHYNGMVFEIARQGGYELVLWTLYPDDIGSPPAGHIYKRIVSGVKNEDIILLHDGIESTVESLPSVLRRIKGKGYRFVTVSELLKIKREGLYAGIGH